MRFPIGAESGAVFPFRRAVDAPYWGREQNGMRGGNPRPRLLEGIGAINSKGRVADFYPWAAGSIPVSRTEWIYEMRAGLTRMWVWLAFFDFDFRRREPFEMVRRWTLNAQAAKESGVQILRI